MAITEAAVHAFHLLHLLHLAQIDLTSAPGPPKRRKSASGPSTTTKTGIRRPRISAPASLFPFVFRPTTIHLSVSAAPVPRPDHTTRRRQGRDNLPSPSPPLEMEMESEMDDGRASSSGSTSSASAAMPTSAPADPDEDVYELDETRIESSPPLRSPPLAEKKKKRKRDRAGEAIRPPAQGADEAEQSKAKKPKQKPKPAELPLPVPPLPGATTIDPRFLLLPSPTSHLSPVSGLASTFSGKKKKTHSQNGPSWVTKTPISSSQ